MLIMSSSNNSSNNYYQLFRSVGSNDLNPPPPQPNSPHHLGMDGTDFSPEDLHHILGAVAGDTSAHHFTESLSHSDLHSLQDAAAFPGDAEKAPADCARTERKRSREKQRRFDVNKQFTELTATVRQIEMETEEYRVPTMYSPNNRADLIARTVALLQALHTMNQKKQKEMLELQEELQRAKLAGEEAAQKLKESMMAPQNVGNNKVIMMVPMMMNSENGGGAAAPSPYIPPFPAASSDPAAWGVMPPWMMQHMVMPPPQVLVPPAPPTSGPTSNGEPKVASTATDSSIVGSNLAHCA